MSISGELGCAPCRLYLVEDLEPFYAETELMYLLGPLYALRKYSRHVSFNAITSETLCDFVLGYRPRHCPYTELPVPFSHVPLSRVQNLNTPTSRGAIHTHSRPRLTRIYYPSHHIAQPHPGFHSFHFSTILPLPMPIRPSRLRTDI